MQDLIECNDFDKFATFTFDPKKHPQCNDLAWACKKIIYFFNNTQKRYGAFNYVLVYEPQKNGNIHFHALLGGFTGHYHATNKRGKAEAERQCYKIDAWERNNGFADMEDISDKSRLAAYLGKYMQKDLSSSIHVKGSKRYYASRGLRRPKKTYGLEMSDIQSNARIKSLPIDHYENEYVEITTFDRL